MVCIQTKIIPATNTRPSRIKAFTCNGHTVTQPRRYEFSTEEDHARTAAALLVSVGWDKIPNCYGQLETVAIVGGATKDGYAFVMIPRISLTWDGLDKAWTTEDFIKWGLIKKESK